MRTEAVRAMEAFTIYDAPKLDPINVVMQDFGIGNGRLIVECYGMAWSHYWGAMGQRSTREFVADTSPGYLRDKLLSHERRVLKREEAYLLQITTAVLAAVRDLHGVGIK